MLGKLMKYEFKATSRRIIPVMVVMAALAVINRIMVPVFLKSTSTGVHSLHMLFDGLLVAAYIALGVVAFLVLINRFYKNILGDEGYTTMTLPVNGNQLLWSKLINPLIWMAIIMAVMLIVLLIRSADMPAIKTFFMEINMTGIKAMFTDVTSAHIIGYAVEILLFCCIVFMDMCLAVYVSLTYGHMFKKHKIFMAALIFAVIVVLGIVAMFNLLLFLDSASYGLSGIFGTGIKDTTSAHMIALMCIVMSAIPGAIMYIATYLGLKKNLNLE